MQALVDSAGRLAASGRKDRPKLTTIFPVLVGRPCPKDSGGYPYSGNFFTDGSAAAADLLADAVSPPAALAVQRFLERSSAVMAAGVRERTVAEAVRGLLAVQASAPLLSLAS